MLLSAFRVSVVGVAHVIVCDTVMLPSSAPPPPVLITTFSVASAVWIVVLAIVAGAALPVNVVVPPAVIEPVLLSAAVISMLKGSSSQVPRIPTGAPTLMLAPLPMPSIGPDVSTKPPLPPLGPPLAAISPSICVSPADNTVTIPPLPCTGGVRRYPRPRLHRHIRSHHRRRHRGTALGARQRGADRHHAAARLARGVDPCAATRRSRCRSSRSRSSPPTVPGARPGADS